MSVAIAPVFGSARQSRCKDRPESATRAMPLTARIDVLPVRGGERFLRTVFEPLGYGVETVRSPLDERFPEWGDRPYFAVTIRKTTTLVDSRDGFALVKSATVRVTKRKAPRRNVRRGPLRKNTYPPFLSTNPPRTRHA
jgi:hypothetical protein